MKADTSSENNLMDYGFANVFSFFILHKREKKNLHSSEIRFVNEDKTKN